MSFDAEELVFVRGATGVQLVTIGNFIDRALADIAAGITASPQAESGDDDAFPRSGYRHVREFASRGVRTN